MSNLVVVAYSDIDRASQVLESLKRMHKEHLIDLEDAAYVTKDAAGKVQLHQGVVNLVGAGAAGGALWGTLIGMLFLMPIAGLAIGAGTGAISGAMSDYGINDKFAKDLAQQMQPGSSAIFVLVRQVSVDKVLPEFASYGGKILHTSLSNEAEERLQNALNTLVPPSGPTQQPQPGTPM